MTKKNTKKLPKYVRQRSWGAYQYKRNVPKHLIQRVGKSTLYHSLGDTYAQMIINLPVVHKESRHCSTIVCLYYLNGFSAGQTRRSKNEY